MSFSRTYRKNARRKLHGCGGLSRFQEKVNGLDGSVARHKHGSCKTDFSPLLAL